MGSVHSMTYIHHDILHFKQINLQLKFYLSKINKKQETACPRFVSWKIRWKTNSISLSHAGVWTHILEARGKQCTCLPLHQESLYHFIQRKDTLHGLSKVKVSQTASAWLFTGLLQRKIAVQREWPESMPDGWVTHGFTGENSSSIQSSLRLTVVHWGQDNSSRIAKWTREEGGGKITNAWIYDPPVHKHRKQSTEPWSKVIIYIYI